MFLLVTCLWKRQKYLLAVKVYVQNMFSLQELKDIVPRILLTHNPQLPDGLVLYNFKKGSFEPVPSPGNTVVVLKTLGTYIPRDGDEARKQMIAQGIDREYSPTRQVYF